MVFSRMARIRNKSSRRRQRHASRGLIHVSVMHAVFATSGLGSHELCFAFKGSGSASQTTFAAYVFQVCAGRHATEMETPPSSNYGFQFNRMCPSYNGQLLQPCYRRCHVVTANVQLEDKCLSTL